MYVLKFAAKLQWRSWKETKTWCPIQTVSMFYSYNVSIYYCLPPDTHKLYNQKRGNFTPVQWRTNFNLLVYAHYMHEPSIYCIAMIFKPFYLFFLFSESLVLCTVDFEKGTLLIRICRLYTIEWIEASKLAKKLLP